MNIIILTIIRIDGLIGVEINTLFKKKVKQ